MQGAFLLQKMAQHNILLQKLTGKEQIHNTSAQ